MLAQKKERPLCAASREIDVWTSGQWIRTRCSTIRLRPCVAIDTLRISLDMDHLLSSSLPGARVSLYCRHLPRKFFIKNNRLNVILNTLFYLARPAIFLGKRNCRAVSMSSPGPNHASTPNPPASAVRPGMIPLLIGRDEFCCTAAVTQSSTVGQNLHEHFLSPAELLAAGRPAVRGIAGVQRHTCLLRRCRDDLAFDRPLALAAPPWGAFNAGGTETPG